MEQETKKKLLIGIWCAAAVLVIAGAAWAWIYFSEYSSYHNKQFKFSVQYPKKWKKDEGFQGAAVIFVRPKQTALDTFQPNVNITVQEVPEHIATLSSFSETITKQMTAVFGPNITILTDKDVRFANKPGHELVFNASKPVDMKMMFVWTMKGSFVYIFTFVGQNKQYKELFPMVQKMINSFETK